MNKEPEKGSTTRLTKAIGYTVIGLTVGFILGLTASSAVHRRQLVITNGNRLALSGEYTAVIVQRERLDENGDIWILDSKVTEVYK